MCVLKDSITYQSSFIQNIEYLSIYLSLPRLLGVTCIQRFM